MVQVGEEACLLQNTKYGWLLSLLFSYELTAQEESTGSGTLRGYLRSSKTVHGLDLGTEEVPCQTLPSLLKIPRLSRSETAVTIN